MIELEIQKFLRANSLAKLEEQYHIIARRHAEYPNLICLKYHMLDSPMGEQIVQECRGLILNEDNNWAIISFPFKKFFNFGEGYAALIDWKTAVVQEKLDGSLMCLYFYKDKWHVQSSGLADAGGGIVSAIWKEDGVTISTPQTFAEYFWKIISLRGLPISPQMTDVPKEYCFIFEMMGPLNRIVVNHKISRIVLIGCRNLVTGQELQVEKARKLLPGNIEIVKQFLLGSINEIVETFSKMNPIEQEGYVVVDSNFNRLKIKCPAYVALHHAKGECITPKILLKIVMTGESDEWVVHFEEYKEDLLKIRLTFERLISDAYESYCNIVRTIGPNATQKDFALLAIKTKYPGALFAYHAYKCNSIRDYFKSIHIDNLMKLLKI